MSLKDFIFIIIMCGFFAGNFVVSAWSVGAHGVPPFLLAACRAAIVLALMSIYLFKPKPEHFLRLLIVCACVGPVHLGFLYTGLMSAPASASAIVSQLLIPFATVLSVVFLKERIGLVRGLAITGAFIGTIIIIYEPGAVGLDSGLIFVTLAYLSLAVGSIIMKTVGDIDWRVYVTWMALCVFVVTVPISLALEPPIQLVWANAKWPLIATAAYAAIGVTIIAHGQYYRLVKTYTVSRVVPLMLMVPIFATFMGVLFLGETVSAQTILASIFILPCVYVIAKRDKSGG